MQFITKAFKAICVSYALFLSVVCPCIGQSLQKLPVKEEDYNLWGTMYLDKISDSGNWVTYKMHYEEHPDTLYLSGSDNKVKYAYPDGSGAAFSEEHHFAVTCAGNLHLLNLQSGKKVEINDVSKFSFCGDNKYLATLEQADGLSKLVLRSPDGIPLKSLEGITFYQANDSGNMLLCTAASWSISKLILIRLENREIVVSEIESKEGSRFANLIWSSNGSAFSYIKEDKNGIARICYYPVAQGKIHTMEAGTTAGFPRDFHIDSGYSSGLNISDDGKRVFFSIEKNTGLADSADGVQVWNGNDAVTYAEHALMIGEERNRRIVAWLPSEGKVIQITDDATPFGFLNATQDYALLYTMDDMETQYVLDRNVNLHLLDLNNGERRLFLEDHSTAYSMSGLSPDGKYFAYYRDNHWNVYNFSTGVHTRINLGAMGQLSLRDEIGNEQPYGIAGWDPKTGSLLLYDEYDVWKIDISGNKDVRLTRGKEKQICFRLAESKNSMQSNFRGHINSSYNVTDGLLFSAASENGRGYFVSDRTGKLRKIVFDGKHNGSIIPSRKNNMYAIIAQDFDVPPMLKVCEPGKADKVIAKSNQHFSRYSWGRIEVIKYKAQLQEVKGLLYYPANFDPSRKYPMIVQVYEQQYYRRYSYINPSLYNMTGINISNLSAKGYFVLLPDIVYTAGSPGLSATECVIAAVNQACRKAPVDKSRIGLAGHSFGGYETNFIITQTDRFACAVSGASVADLQSHYLSIGWYTGKPEIWRFESQQWRMGKSLFEAPENYTENSPMHKVAAVTTPLFLWAGEEDRQVHYYQSIAFYLALRRLGKKEIMVIYPREGHAILTPENQADLTRRTEAWFDYYLKGVDPPMWIAKGIK